MSKRWALASQVELFKSLLDYFFGKNEIRLFPGFQPRFRGSRAVTSPYAVISCLLLHKLEEILDQYLKATGL